MQGGGSLCMQQCCPAHVQVFSGSAAVRWQVVFVPVPMLLSCNAFVNDSGARGVRIWVYRHYKAATMFGGLCHPRHRLEDGTLWLGPIWDDCDVKPYQKPIFDILSFSFTQQPAKSKDTPLLVPACRLHKPKWYQAQR